MVWHLQLQDPSIFTPILDLVRECQVAGEGTRETPHPPFVWCSLAGAAVVFLPVLGPLQWETDFNPTLQMGQLRPRPHHCSGRSTRITTQSRNQVQPHAVGHRLDDLK